MYLAQGTTQRFNFAFIGEFLAFREFHEFEHLLHLIGGALQCIHNFQHFINCLADRRASMCRFGLSNALGQTLGAINQRARIGWTSGRNGLWRSSCIGRLRIWFDGLRRMRQGGHRC